MLCRIEPLQVCARLGVYAHDSRPSIVHIEAGMSMRLYGDDMLVEILLGGQHKSPSFLEYPAAVDRPTEEHRTSLTSQHAQCPTTSASLSLVRELKSHLAHA